MDSSLHALGLRHRWIVTTFQLLTLGIGSAGIRRRIDAGVLVRLFHGVYLVGRRAPTAAERQHAALLAAGTEAARSFETAAAVHGWLPAPKDVHVTTPTQRRSQPGLVTHHSPLARQDVTTRGGLRITTVARTLSDIAAAGGDVERCVHEAEVRKQLRPDAVAAASARAGHRPGQRRLLELVAARDLRVGRGGNELAQRVHAELQGRGFPRFEVEVGFELDDGEKVSLDVLFRDAWYALEIDGGVHGTVRHFEGDRRRDRRLLALLDLPVGRVTQKDVDQRVDEWAADLRAILDRRTKRPPSGRSVSGS